MGYNIIHPRRITIDSTSTQHGRQALCFIGFRAGSYGKGRAGTPSPVLSRPSRRGPQLRGLIERYTDYTNGYMS
jgi:hypothetical protein